MSDIVTLVKQTYEQDDLGDFEAQETEREVFCKISSVSQSEFFRAAQEGLEADLKIEVWEHDYEGEMLAKIDGVTYTVYRTYKVNDLRRELYLSEKVSG